MLLYKCTEGFLLLRRHTEQDQSAFPPSEVFSLLGEITRHTLQMAFGFILSKLVRISLGLLLGSVPTHLLIVGCCA